MPWKETTPMTLRREFVALALGQGLSVAELARRFGISRKTAYKWLHRQAEGGSLDDRPRRPHTSPTRTGEALTQAVLALRRAHPCWGGRKLHRVLCNDGYTGVPAPSTITHLLRRHGLIGDGPPGLHRPWQRFEHRAPNDLWQMDFKGTIAVGTGRCDPLTVLDDHSRYNLVLQATPDTRTATVQAALTAAFRRYGLPQRMNMDNGPPWGCPGGDSRGLSALSLWLVRLGIQVSFSTPVHPQTNGKEERFHRSLKAEVLHGRLWRDHAHLQRALDDWRAIYNHRRPHEGVGLLVPGARYQPSRRRFPDTLPPIEYGADDDVLTVHWGGWITFQGRTLKVSNALRGLPIAVRPTLDDGVYDLYFMHHRIATFDSRQDD
jgi:transposase InsO family protein